MLNTFKSILFFPSVTKFKIFILISISLAVAFFEGFGVAMLFPILDFIEKGKDFAVLKDNSKMWLYIGTVFDFLSIPKNLIALIGIVFGLLMIRQLCIYLKNIYSSWVTESILSDIRNEGFEWSARADMPFFDAHGVGQLINIMTVDGGRAGAGIFTFFNLVSASTIFLLYFIFLLILSPGMTFFAIVIMAGVGIILKSRIKRSKEIGFEISKYNEKISSSLVERLNGIRLLKLSATEDSETEFIKDLSINIKNNSYNLAKIKARMEFMVDPIVILAGLIILYFSVEAFHMTIAQTGVFLFVLLRLMPYTKDIFKSRQAMAGFSGSLFKVKDLLVAAKKANSITGGDLTDIRIRKGIRFDGLSFCYDRNSDLVLKDINVFIPAGKMTALVGRSGAGKSTFVDLIPRLRVPIEGKITVDEVPIENYDLVTLRRSIAFVSQEGFLFNDTIENNIRYSRIEASDDDIIKAAKMAYADPFIKEMPEQYQTIVGERGVKLSGGQRQRIILARALLQKARIIILDEPTSSLDSESEKYIEKAMESIRCEQQITMVIIAHRLSTIKSADQIIVLDKGKVVECGSHVELMHEDTWYSDMVKMQAVG